jgi:hypothetical protein
MSDAIQILTSLLRSACGRNIIQIVNRASRTVQRFVFGRNVRSPAMNLVSTFLIGNQSRMPSRNFSRFILTNYIFWCLIIRTAFQSMLFNDLQKDLRKPIPKTVAEIIYQGLTFYGHPDMLKDIELFLDDELRSK